MYTKFYRKKQIIEEKHKDILERDNQNDQDDKKDKVDKKENTNY